MKSISIILRSAALGVGLLAATAFAGSSFVEVYYPDSPANGTVYNVPSGAFYEWEVSGDAHVIIDGGGLSVNEYGSATYKGDAGSTAYTDNISYQINAFGSGGHALFYLGW